MIRPPLAAAVVAVSIVASAAAVLARTPLPPRGNVSVHDTAGVIAPAHAQQLEQLHRDLFVQTGVAIVVVTVGRLEGETIDELAVRIGQDWGVGRRGEDRGLVIAFSRDDRKIFVATGYGTEGFLPDGRVGRIIDSAAVPLLREDRFSEGLFQLASELAAIAAQEYGATLEGAPTPPPAYQAPPGSCGAAEGIVLVLLAIGFGYLAIRHPRLLALILINSLLRGGGGRRGGSGFGGGGGFGGFGGGGFGGGGAGRSF
jgi:uncharacterized protein